MTAETYLSRLTNIDRRISDKLEEAETWYAIAENHSASPLSEDKVQTSHNQDKMGQAVACAVDCYEEATRIFEQITKYKKKALRQIEGIDDELHYNILYGKYVKGKTFTELGAELHYSSKQVRHHHAIALKEFEEKYGKDLTEWYEIS